MSEPGGPEGQRFYGTTSSPALDRHPAAGGLRHDVRPRARGRLPADDQLRAVPARARAPGRAGLAPRRPPRTSPRLWRRLGDFDDLDLDGDGVLTRDEVAVALAKRRGCPPSPIFLDNVGTARKPALPRRASRGECISRHMCTAKKQVMAAIDFDHSGCITREEFEHRVDH